jgi:phosphatidylserine decarboxylase
MKHEITFCIIIFIIIFLLYFHRTPERNLSYNENIIVSPCDGTVTYSNGRHISVFLSVFDVHVQYVPIKSKIIHIETVKKGTHHLAILPESSHNEGVKVIFRSKIGDITVTQRVGFFVRRIRNSIKLNQIVERSEPYGFITFGSRVDIILPENYNSIVKIGDKLKGGETLL